MENNEQDSLQTRIGHDDGRRAGLDRKVKSYWLTSMQSSLLRQGKSKEYVDAFIAAFVEARVTWTTK